MGSRNLPLLHKYVFNHDDDLQLKMSKLQYRLCVQEVSHVILGKHNQLDLSDIEPSIEPDFTMATTVEAHPPRMEDFPPSHDEGLSSPDSEDFPQKSQNEDYMYNDSGILLDESTLNNMPQEHETNGDTDDNLSDVSDVSDPSDYHISRNNEHQQVNSYHNDNVCNNTQSEHDDSAVFVNGGSSLENEDEIMEETIERVERTQESADVSFESLPQPTEEEMEQQQNTESEEGTTTTTTTTVITTRTEHTTNESAEMPVVIVTEPERTVEEEPESDEEEDEVVEQVILRSEVKHEEEEPEEEVEKVDFVPGLACNDVETALQILKTHYRLSCSNLKKCIITSPDSRNKRYSAPVFSYGRSKWNLEDMVRTPNDDSPWWNPEAEPILEEKENVVSITDTINRKDDEIAKLLQKVLDEERKKEEEKERQNPPPEPEIIAIKEEPALEAIPENESESPVDAEPSKKKKGNIFQRMMRALRKRMSRNRQSA